MSGSDFAKKVIKSINDKIPSSTVGLNAPLLFIVGEEHMDADEASKKNPAMQALYSEIAVLELARQKFGAEKVSLSVELSPKSLQVLKNWIITSGVPDQLQDQVFVHAIQYAIQHNIAVFPSQTDEQLSWQPADALSPAGMEARNTTMIETINQLASRHSDGAVVHIVGAGHLYGLAGVSNDDLHEQDGAVLKEPEKNPFRDRFASTIIINTASYTEDELARMTSYGLSQQNFFSNPSNAMQLVTPTDYTVPTPVDIVNAVLEAARSLEAEDQNHATKHSAISSEGTTHSNSILAEMNEEQRAVFTARLEENLKQHLFKLQSSQEFSAP